MFYQPLGGASGIFGAMMAPKIARGAPRETLGAAWEHLEANEAPKIAKRSSKRRQDGELGAKMGEDRAQEAVKCSQDGDLGSVLEAFGVEFQ